MSCYENNLVGDPAERRRIHSHLKSCVRAASALGVPHVGTFVGRDPARTVSDNLREAEQVLPELVRYADDHGVRLVIENWNRIIDTLYTGGFDGAVAVEHEDPVWGGTHTKIKQGLEIAIQTLRPLIR